MDDLNSSAIAVSLVLLMVRLLLAVIFTYEVKVKLKDIKQFAKNDGLPVSVAYLVVVAEAAAALGMLTGILAQWAGLGVMALMVITMSFHWFKWRTPYWANKGGWEYDLIIFVLAAVIAVLGAGQAVLF